MARIFGIDIKARCRQGQPASDNVKLSLSPRTLRLAAPGEAGVAARVRRALYQGGYFKVEAITEQKPDVRLIIHAPESAAEGDAVTIAVDDGWVIPSRP